METDPALVLVLEALKAALAVPGRRVRFVQLLMEDGTSQLITLPAKDSMPRTEAAPTGKRCSSPGAQRLRGLILEQLRLVDKPISQAGLARKCGRANSGHFRETLETLVGGGEVRRLPTGHYWLPGRNLPSGWQG